MNKTLKVPFRDMTPEAWQNLALLAVAVFYVAQVGLDLIWHNLCGHLAIDYCSFWSAGHIASASGYAKVYDLNLMEQIQRSVFPRRYEVQGTFATVPTPYLPPFIVPFAFLAGLGPFVGYWVWTVFNLAVFIGYFIFFTKKTTGQPPSRRLFALILLSFPVFLDFFYGQVNIWLMVFVGEYMRAELDGKPFRAGLWLGGLLIKPQYLALIGIALLMQRSIKALAGLAVSSLVIMAVSYAMVGSAGFVAMIQLWLGYTSGLPATGPNVMMNWRMLGLFLEGLFNAPWVWPLMFAGMAVTAIAGLYLWRHPVDWHSWSSPVVLLGILAATGAVAWHSHISTQTILIPPLIYLNQPRNRLPKNALLLWVIIPPIFQFGVLVLGGLAQGGVLTGNVADWQNLLSAIVPFGFNLYFLAWAIQTMRSMRAQAVPVAEAAA